MGALQVFGKWFWRFMVIFSFIVNFVLVIVLLVLGLLIFQIKNNIAEPLVGGLHSSFVGLNDATIDWTIPVRDSIGINLNVPINSSTITSQVIPPDGSAPITGETIVTLTRDVPLVINNAFIQSSDLTLRNAQVNIVLPAGTLLPVSLDLAVGIQAEIPVNLDVRAVIPLGETQLHDVADNLRLLFEPLAVALINLPDNFGEAFDLVGDVMSGDANLLRDERGDEYLAQPWPGYSQTAGLNYTLFNEPVPSTSVPVNTGIVPTGGIGLLDEQIRPDLYDDNGPEGPEAINEQAALDMEARGIPAYYYNGRLSETMMGGEATTQSPSVEDQGILGPSEGTSTNPEITPLPGGDSGIAPPDATSPPSEDQGIIPPPGG